MAYATQAQLEDRYHPDDVVKFADFDGDGIADADVVGRALDDASGLIDSYLQKQFVVPIPAPIPDSIVSACITLAWCNLLRGRRSLDEDSRKDCEAVREWLQKVADGDIEIGLVPKPTESAGKPHVEYDADDREFGRDKFL